MINVRDAELPNIVVFFSIDKQSKKWDGGIRLLFNQHVSGTLGLLFHNKANG